MPIIPPLTDSYIDETYPRLVQISGSSFADGLGVPITFGTTNTGSLLLTASIVGGNNTSNQIEFKKGDGTLFTITVNTGSGGSGTPGSPLNSIQYNSGGTFAGSSSLTFDGSNITLTGSLLVTQSHISSVDYIDFTLLPNTSQPDQNEGRLFWNSDAKTLHLDLEQNFHTNLNQQLLVRVVNTTGVSVPIATIVYISGSQGTRPGIATASWEGDQTSAATLGFTAKTINHNNNGYVITRGILDGVNTSAYSVGSQLYLSSSGQFTNTPPDAPLHEVRLGKVIVSDATVGSIYVDITNGYELTELHDVKTTSYSAGDLLVQSGSLWINSKTLTGSYTLSGSLTTNDGVSVQTLTASAISASQITGSLFGTASWATNVVSASITYVTSSNQSLSEIEVADYSNDVVVTYVNGRLKFIFGTPASQSITSFTFGGTFETDRWNKELYPYTASAVWANNAYNLISASIFTGSVLLTSIGTGTTLNYSTTTSGSQSYILHVTASSPLDSSIKIISSSLAGTISKINPISPTQVETATVQLGASSNEIEQGATGSIAITSITGSANRWTIRSFSATGSYSSIKVNLFGNTNGAQETATFFVTGSTTGSNNIIITTTASYDSNGLNSPEVTAIVNDSITYNKIRSVRYAVTATSSFTQAQLEKLTLWTPSLGSTGELTGSITKGTVNPYGYTFTVSPNAQRIYIIIDQAYTLTSIRNTSSNTNDIAAFNTTIVGDYRIYSSSLALATINYELLT